MCREMTKQRLVRFARLADDKIASAVVAQDAGRRDFDRNVDDRRDDRVCDHRAQLIEVLDAVLQPENDGAPCEVRRDRARGVRRRR